MTLKFANPKLEAADATLRALNDGKWHIGYGIGLENCATYLLRLRMVERRLPPPITKGRKKNGRNPAYEYRLTEVGKTLAEVLANLRGESNG